MNNSISRRRFLRDGAVILIGTGISHNVFANVQHNKPMLKRSPTASELKMVQDYHSKKTNVLFQDDFRSHDTLEKNWRIFTDDRPDLKACRTKKSLSISNAGLAIKTVAADHCNAKWSTGQIISKRSFLYGLYEAYIEIAHGTGVDNAFWLTTDGTLDDGTGDSFEIDVAEVYYPSLIRSTLHRHNLTLSKDRYETGYNNPLKENLASGFHDYGVLWTPDTLIFCLDGIAYQTIETQGTINAPANLRLSTALGIFGGNPPKNPVGLDMQVKHVRVIGL